MISRRIPLWTQKHSSWMSLSPLVATPPPASARRPATATPRVTLHAIQPQVGAEAPRLASLDNDLVRMRTAVALSKVNEARWSKAVERAHEDVESLIRVAKQLDAARTSAEHQLARAQEANALIHGENSVLQDRVAELEGWRQTVEGALKAAGIVIRVPTADETSSAPRSEKPLEPITYSEAFEAIGGTAKLDEYEAASKEIEAQVSNAALDAELKLLLPRDYERRTGFSTKLVNQAYATSRISTRRPTPSTRPSTRRYASSPGRPTATRSCHLSRGRCARA